MAPAELLDFLRGSLGPDRARRVLSHLARCPGCRALGAPASPTPITPDTGPRRRRGGGPPRRMARPQAAAQAARVRRLLEQCGPLRHSDPWEALRLADLARQAAARLVPGPGGAARVVDWVARATAELGNAHRLTGDLAAAEHCLQRALALAWRGSGEPRLVATIADLAASLLTYQRRFAAAGAILERLRELYLHLGDRPLAARARLSQSLVLSYAGEAERALPVLLAALAEIDAAQAPQLAAYTLHNLAKLLVDLGRPEAARRVLQSAQGAGRLAALPVDRLRRRWLEGRIAAALGAEPEAETALRQATEGFAAAGLVYPGALAALDLAALWVRLERRFQARELLAWATNTFRRLGIAREAIAALLLLRPLPSAATASNEALLAAIGRAAARLRELAAHQPHRSE